MFIIGFICGAFFTVIAAIMTQQLLARSVVEPCPVADYGYVKQQMELASQKCHLTKSSV